MNVSSGVLIIVWAELTAWRNRIAGRSPARSILVALFLLLAVIVIGGAAFSAGAYLSRFLPAIRDPLLASGFTALSVLMLVVGFPTVIATLFVGRELLQLVLAPIRSFEILAARSLIAMSANFLIGGILLAGVLGIGFGAGAPPIYYPLTILLIAAQVLVVTSVQAILLSLVLRLVPARLARDVAAAVAGLTGAGFYLAWNLSLRQSFSPSTRTRVADLSGLVHQIDWLPSGWPGRALGATIDGSAGLAVGWAAVTVLLGALLFSLAAVLYRSTLLAGLGVFGGSQARWTRRATAGRSQGAGPGYPGRAIARKDWLGYRRDIRRLSRLVPAILFPVGYAFAFLRPSSSFGGFWSEVFFVAFITMFMSTALATPAIPSERRGFQLLRMSPLAMSEVLRAKIGLTLPPVVVLTSLFSTAIGLAAGQGPLQIVEVTVLVLWLGLGFVSIGVSVGAIDPHFDATDDRRAVGLVGSLVGIGASLAFGTASVGAFAVLLLVPGVAAGTVVLGPIAASPALAALMGTGAIALGLGAAGVVGLMVSVANARLGAFEAAIAPS
jgi:ABC-2 type transport system permease protein